MRAYRDGAQTLRNTRQDVDKPVHGEGTDALTELPNIGSGIAAVIDEYVDSGKSTLLDDLQAKVSPENVLMRVPGLGKTLAQRAVEQLHIHTLEELEAAAHDGRLGEVAGFGKRRVEGIEAALAGMLSRSARSKQRTRTAIPKDSEAASDDRPSIKLLLAIDAEYRNRAQAGDLHKIAPRRLNPTDEVWLPVLNTKREGWAFTALYSNTAQAHQLDKTQDWVVIYYERDSKERQYTIVTETKGSLKGKRVVRGREPENCQYYQAQQGQ